MPNPSEQPAKEDVWRIFLRQARDIRDAHWHKYGRAPKLRCRMTMQAYREIASSHSFIIAGAQKALPPSKIAFSLPMIDDIPTEIVYPFDGWKQIRGSAWAIFIVTPPPSQPQA